MRYFAGIDGGQSSTTAVVGDETGRIVGRGTAGPADETGAGPDSTRLRDALGGALRAALLDAALPDAARLDRVVAGVSGYEGRIHGRAPDIPSDGLLVVHDAPIAHAGALGGEPGVVVIAGTGSVVFSRDAHGQARTSGGWGFLFGDEGSAFWIAREALARMMCLEDAADSPHGDETRAACEFFGVLSLREFARAFYAGELTRDRVAAFAPVALHFECFRDVADRGADRLAGLACEAMRACACATIAFVGGTFADERFARRLRAGVREGGREVRIIEPRYEPAVGALMLAYREAGTGVELRA